MAGVRGGGTAGVRGGVRMGPHRGARRRRGGGCGSAICRWRRGRRGGGGLIGEWGRRCEGEGKDMIMGMGYGVWGGRDEVMLMG